MNPNLNLNLGVRYTYHGVLYDDKDTVTNFVPRKCFLAPGVDAPGLGFGEPRSMQLALKIMF